MADIAAPYITASEINSQAGDAALGGVKANFDPANKEPLQNLQNTFTRLDTEDFQRQQQEDRQRHDILTHMMENEHQDKVLRYSQSMKDRQDMFNFFNQKRVSAATLKDPNGDDASIGFLPQDQQMLNKDAEDFHKWVFEDVGKNKYSPEFKERNDEFEQKTNNASMRSVFYKKAQQLLQNTYDPTEKKRIQDYLDSYKDTELDSKNVPTAFVELPTIKPLIDVQKDYKDGKGYQSFDKGEGVPNSRYQGLATTTDPTTLNEGFKRYQFFKSQPQGQNAEEYNNFQNELNKITEQRNLPSIDLGGTFTSDGKVVFDESTPRKQQALARKMLVATELLNNGRLQPGDKKESLEQEKLEAQISKEKAGTQKDIVETAIKQKELENGKSKPLTPEEQQIIESSNNTVRRAWGIFNPEKYEGKEGTPIQSETKVTKTHWFIPNETEEGYKPVAGVDIGAALKSEGLNPTDYKVFQAPAGIEEGVGKQRVGIGVNAKNEPNGKEFKTGENEKVDKAFTLYNPTTKEVKLAFFKNVTKKVDGETKTEPQLVNIVSGRDYVTHAPNEKYQWGIHGGKQVSNLSFETEQNQNLWDKIHYQAPQITTPAAQPTKTKTIGGVTYEQTNGKWYKVQ